MKEQVRLLHHPSSILGRSRKRCIAVAPAEKDARGPWPICYFLHGWGGNAESYLGHPAIRRLVLAAPQVSVFPESFRRWFINDHQGNRYEDYFVEELLPFVEGELAPLVDPGRRALLGFSMGGAAAFLLAARHPGLFPAVVCHAGAFDAPHRRGDPYAHLRGSGGEILMPNQDEHDSVWGPPGSAIRREYDPRRFVRPDLAGRMALYLDVGTEDYPRMLEMNRSFHHALEAAGVPHQYEERPGQHDMDFVAAGLPRSLSFLAGAGSCRG